MTIRLPPLRRCPPPFYWHTQFGSAGRPSLSGPSLRFLSCRLFDQAEPLSLAGELPPLLLRPRRLFRPRSRLRLRCTPGLVGLAELLGRPPPLHLATLRPVANRPLGHHARRGAICKDILIFRGVG